jgi:hypothetical protein
MKTDILFIIFNRLEVAKRVFSAIRDQKPERLFVAADGARSDKPAEQEQCDIIRKWVLDHIDWDCRVETLFHEKNKGPGFAQIEAIGWFLGQVEEGIILEDDCLPCPSFFRFCEENLEKYRNNKKISMISGNNFQLSQPMPINSDYYFSIFPSSNGWAAWRRSWQAYDHYIRQWKNSDEKQFLSFLFKEKKYQLWWKNKFDWIYENQPNDLWDFKFHYCCMARKQLAIIPKANLVTNIGYGPNATHTFNPDSYFANVPTYELLFPLDHPEAIVRNYEADLFIQKMLFGEVEIVSPWKRVKRLIKRLIRYKPKV